MMTASDLEHGLILLVLGTLAFVSAASAWSAWSWLSPILRSWHQLINKD